MSYLAGPLVGTVVLFLAMTALVVVEKARRTLSEARSRRRRDALAELIGRGFADSAVALVERGGRGARDDLAAVLPRLAPSLTPAYRDALYGRIRAGGLGAAVVRDLARARPSRRGRAAIAAALLDLPDTVAAVAPLLRARDADVRAAALKALGTVATPDAAAALVRALSEEAAPPERIVERLANAWAADTVFAAFDVPEHRRVRRWLVAALAAADDPRAAALAQRLLVEATTEDRIHACRALSRGDASHAAPALLDALRDEEWTVRAQAAKALAGVTRPVVVSALAAALTDRSWWVRSNAAEALVRCGAAGRAALHAALRSDDAYARDRAAEALGYDPLRVQEPALVA